MSLLYDRIIDEIGDQHSALVEKFVQECSGKKPVTENNDIFLIIKQLHNPPDGNNMPKHKKEEIEKMLIESIDAGKSDDELIQMAYSFASSSEGIGDVIGDFVPNS